MISCHYEVTFLNIFIVFIFTFFELQHSISISSLKAEYFSWYFDTRKSNLV